MDDEDIVIRACNFRGSKEDEEYGKERGRRWKQQGFLI